VDDPLYLPKGPTDHVGSFRLRYLLVYRFLHNLQSLRFMVIVPLIPIVTSLH
jgi:hypothetical protein